MTEECKVFLRNTRRDTNNMLKDMKKEKEISEDDLFKLQDEVQKITDKYVKKSDETLAAKEKEVLEI
jgi:ribosome recycling factor